MSRVAIAVVMALLLPGSVGAQRVSQEEKEDFRMMFEELMYERLEELNDEEGVELVPVGELWVDYLPKGPGKPSLEARMDRRFDGGDGQYLVLGLCDEDCPDIDLHLWDPQKKGAPPVLSDTEPDAEPLLVSGIFDDGLIDGKEYSIDLRMFDCQVEYCFFAVGVFRFEEAQ